MIRSILFILSLAVCGTVSADPTTSRHGIEDHSELYRQSFCLVSYSMWQSLFAKDPTIPSTAKFEIEARMSGLRAHLLTSTVGAGHTRSELDDWLQFIHDGMSLSTPDVWVAAVKRMGCRELTEEWSSYNIL